MRSASMGYSQDPTHIIKRCKYHIALKGVEVSGDIKNCYPTMEEEFQTKNMINMIDHEEDKTITEGIKFKEVNNNKES
jgi:hypothetical protein